jgi:hypothetical protein
MAGVRILLLLPVIFFLTSSLSGQTPPQPTPSQIAMLEAVAKARQEQNQRRQMYPLLESLPQEIDALIVANGPVTPVAPASADHSLTGIQEAMADLSIGMFRSVAGGKLHRERRSLRFAVTAIRTSPFQACSLLGTVVPVTRNDFRAAEDATVLAHPVWTSTGERFAPWRLPREPTEMFYSTIIWPTLILTCNHKDLFRSVLEGARAADPPRGIEINKWSWSGVLPRFPEVKRLDWMTASMWAVRHFRGLSDSKEPATGLGLELGGRDPGIHATWFTTGTAHPWTALAKPAGVEIRKVEGGWTLITGSHNDDPKLAGLLLAALLGFGTF